MLTVFRTHPLLHVSYLLVVVPGMVLLANGAVSITILVIYGGIVAFAHSNTRLSFGLLGRVSRESELPPHPPSAGRTTGCEPRVCLTIWDQFFTVPSSQATATVRVSTRVCLGDR